MLCPFIKADGSRFLERVHKAYGDNCPPPVWSLVHDIDRGIRYLSFTAFDTCPPLRRRRQVDYRRVDVVFPDDFVGPLEGACITRSYWGDVLTEHERVVSFYCEDDATAERLRARFR